MFAFVNNEVRYKRPESVLVVVHTDSQVLLLKRADHSNFWQSVTGSLEHDELPYEAAKRELHEETGIQVDQLRTTGISRTYEILDEWKKRYAPGTNRNREHLFYCHLNEECSIQIDPMEHTEYQWVPIKQASEQVFSWSNKLGIMSLG